MSPLNVQNNLSPGPCSYIILGGGAVVLEYYLPAFSRLGWLNKVLVIDSSPDTLKTLRDFYPDIKTSQEDFNSFFGRSDLPGKFNAVIVALPNRLHEKAVSQALDRGFHVLCEKPLSLNKQSCFLLGNRAKERGKFLAVGMTRRLLPSVMALRQAIDRGMIGPVLEVDIEDGVPYVWPSETGAFFDKENGGVLADMGIHYLDIVQDLLGPLEPVAYADDCRGGVEANCEFTMRSLSGVPVKLKLSRSHFLRNTAIFKGSAGRLILKKDVFDRCLWFPSETSQTPQGLSAEIRLEKPFRSGPWEPDFEPAFAEEFFEFHETISTGKEPRVDAYKAAETVALIEWAYQHRIRVLPKQNDLGEARLKRPHLPISKVLVTGGTGFIGQNLVSRLTELGFEDITVPVRNYRTCTEIACSPVQMPRINLLDYGQLKKAIQGSRFVFHLAYGKDGQEASKLTVDGTKNVVNAAIECGSESIVILSTIYVFGSSRSIACINESSPYRPIGAYGKSKAKMEQWCLERAKSSSSTRVVILNPSCVYGPGGETYTELPVLMARDGSFCWVEDGQGIANFTYVDNLIDAMLLAALCKEAHGNRFIVNDGGCSWKDFLGPIVAHASTGLPSYSRKELIQLKKRRTSLLLRQFLHSVLRSDALRDLVHEVTVLRWMKNAVAASMPSLKKKIKSLPSVHGEDFLSDHLNDGSRVPPVWLYDLFGPTMSTFASEKVRRILGWEPAVDLKEGQRRSLAWLQDRFR